jgi:hypothetical protein
MSLTLATYYFAHQAAHAAAGDVACYPTNVRTKSAIMWSCFVTVLSCSWVAIHPDIPGPNTTRWTMFLRRVQLNIMALAPEVIIIFAVRQWVSAYKLKYKYHCMFVLLSNFNHAC